MGRASDDGCAMWFERIFCLACAAQDRVKVWHTTRGYMSGSLMQM